MNEENDKKEDDFEDVVFEESTEDGEALASKDISKKLRQDLKICRKEKEEFLTGWQRAKADYINLQKDLDSTRINTSIITKEKVVLNLLPALDGFDMAFSHKESWEKVDKDWRQGMESIYQQLINGLKNLEVERIDSDKVIFDPNIHQSIGLVETDKEEENHKIEKILQAGYKIGDRIIRPAKVTVYEYKK